MILHCVGLHIQPALKALSYFLMFEEKCSLQFHSMILISKLGILLRWLISVIEKVGTFVFLDPVLALEPKAYVILLVAAQ